MLLKGFSRIVLIAMLTSFFFYCGCVEREITIITEPPGALVLLNDEEIGTSPITVGFEWYGDYAVQISKDGYQTLSTHQNLKRPLRDMVLIDLLDDMFSTRIDEYTWAFKLEPYQPIEKEELIKSAVDLRKEALIDSNQYAVKKKVKKQKANKNL